MVVGTVRAALGGLRYDEAHRGAPITPAMVTGLVGGLLPFLQSSGAELPC
jgi:hypothetical protein